MKGIDRFPGLTEGLSSKIMRANRSALLPSLMLLHQNNADRSDVLNGRLDELLVFEILKDGYVILSAGDATLSSITNNGISFFQSQRDNV